LEFTYANGGAADRTGTLSVNDSEANAAASFPPTTDWTTWTTASFDLTLTTGENRITLSAGTAEGLANIDSIRITGAALTPFECSPAAATGGASGTGGMDMGTGGNGEDLPNTTIYVAGDSTVSTYADTASPNDQAGWGQMLHEIFDDRVTVENRALGGRTALWFHLEGETQYVLDRIKPGEYWFIQFGTNDSHPTATFTVDEVTYPRLAPADTTFKEHLLDYYITPTRAIHAVPVLVTPPPRNSGYCGNGNSLGGYAKAMRDLGAAENVLVLDLNQRTFDHLSAICPSPTPEDFFFVKADNTVDGTHFQENGARQMAGFLGDEMTNQSAGPFQYLLP
jgi:lysophospholipase L1-like esterase